MTYFPSGRLKSEQWCRHSQIEQACYRYSLQGRLLGYSDVFGHTQQSDYDAQGRLQRVQYGTMEARLSYHVLGRLKQSIVHDQISDRKLTTTLVYDDLGREVERTLVLDGEPAQVLSQRFTVTDKLDRRTLKTGSTILRDEHYQYDARGRLTQYQCSGTQMSQDPYGKLIRSQQYQYDAWDNIIMLTTEFAGGQDIAHYSYTNQNDPTQLTEIRHSHVDYPAMVILQYDADGNLIHDEQERSLGYNALGQLTQIARGVQEVLGRYHYDPLDQLVALEQAGQSGIRRTYRDKQLVNEAQGGIQRSYGRQNTLLFSQQERGPNPRTMLYGTDGQQSVLRMANGTEKQEIAYSPYGWRPANAGLPGLLGFNGESLDPVSDGYLLGNGYRLYNPTLMRFHSPDSLSPFNGGGINPYVYCLGDPINRTDPTGHLSWKSILGIVMGAIAAVIAVASLGTGATISAGLIVNVGATLSAFAVSGTVSAGVAVTGAAAAVTGIASSALSESDSSASGILGWVSLGLSLGAVVAGGVSAGIGTGISTSNRAWAVGLTTTGLVAGGADLSAKILEKTNNAVSEGLGWLALGLGTVGTIGSVAAIRHAGRSSRSHDFSSRTVAGNRADIELLTYRSMGADTMLKAVAAVRESFAVTAVGKSR